MYITIPRGARKLLNSMLKYVESDKIVFHNDHDSDQSSEDKMSTIILVITTSNEFVLSFWVTPLYDEFICQCKNPLLTYMGQKLHLTRMSKGLTLYKNGIEILRTGKIFRQTTVILNSTTETNIPFKITDLTRTDKAKWYIIALWYLKRGIWALLPKDIIESLIDYYRLVEENNLYFSQEDEK